VKFCICILSKFVTPKSVFRLVFNLFHSFSYIFNFYWFSLTTLSLSHFTFFSPYLPCTLYTTAAFSSFFPHFSIPHPRHLPAVTRIQPIPRYTTPPANNTPNLHAPRLPPSYFSLPNAPSVSAVPRFLFFFSSLVTLS